MEGEDRRDPGIEVGRARQIEVDTDQQRRGQRAGPRGQPPARGQPVGGPATADRQGDDHQRQQGHAAEDRRAVQRRAPTDDEPAHMRRRDGC